MSGTPKISAIEYKLGEQLWRRDEQGRWSVMMFGSFPFQRTPGLVWQWVAVPDERVPEELRVKK